MFYLSLFASKLINFLSGAFGFGAGYTWPGYVALKIFPGLFKSKYFSYSNGVILVTGTNGKTTTTKIISHILGMNGYDVLYNKSGANTINGIASCVLMDRDFLGRTKSNIAVFEVDEFYFPYFLENSKPIIALMLNLSRDQLDRYGEVDIVYDRWREQLKKTDIKKTVLVADSTQEVFKDLKEFFKGDIYFFDNDKSSLEFTDLLGEFNAKNINASLKVSELLNISRKKALESLSMFGAAFGRGELIRAGDKDIKILLAKNPSSFNNNLDVIIENYTDIKNVMIILNDNIPDGRDVSWIYDIEPDKLVCALKEKTLYVSGKRCLDMAIRLSYAGLKVDKNNISVDIREVLKKVLKSDASEGVLVLPNYSAMLETRKILSGKKIL